MSIHLCAQPLATAASFDHIPQEPPPRALYPIKEAVVILAVSRSQLYRLIASGRLDARKIGSKTVVTAASMEALIADLPAAKVGAV